MNGTDHQLPQPWLGAGRRRSQRAAGRLPLRGHVARRVPRRAAGRRAAATWPGELRSGRARNVLMGVASNRVDVHQAARPRRTRDRTARRTAARAVPPGRRSTRHRCSTSRGSSLVLDSAHDSSCACSARRSRRRRCVVRYQEARQIGDALTRRRAASRSAADVDAPPASTIVVNPTQTERGGLVAIPVPGDGPMHMVAVDGSPRPTQLVSRTTGDGLSTTVTGPKIRWVVEMMRGPEFAGAQIARVERRDLADGTVELTLHNAGPGDTPIDLEATARGAARRSAKRARPSASGSGKAPVRGGRLRRRRACPASAGARTASRRAAARPPRSGPTGTTLANEHVQVDVDPDDGTLAITVDGLRVEGANRLRRRRRRRRHLQLLAARRRPDRRPARRRCASRCSNAARCAPGCS